MITKRELKNKIAHVCHSRLTPAEIQAITPELLNSNIGDGSEKSKFTVALCLALSGYGDKILAADNYALALSIKPQTLNKVIKHGVFAGYSIPFWLAQTITGREILAADNYALALSIKPQTLNTVVESEPWAGYSVAFFLACYQPSILAASDYFLGSKINKLVLNHITKDFYRRGQGRTVAIGLASSIEGRTILAANYNSLALLITPQILVLRVTGGDFYPYKRKSVSSFLRTAGKKGVALLNAIKERHRNNALMLTLYSGTLPRLNTRSNLRLLPKELMPLVLEHLDGRSRISKIKPC